MRQKKVHQLYCPASVSGIPHPELWSKHSSPGWLTTPVPVNPDRPGSLVGLKSPEGTPGYDGLIQPTRAAVRAWLKNGGDIAMIEEMAARLGCDWSGIVVKRRKVALAMPDGSERLCSITDELMPRIQALSIFRGVRYCAAGGATRDVLRLVKNAHFEAGNLGPVGELTLIIRRVINDDRNNKRWADWARDAT